MNEMQVFNNEQFGQVRTVIVDGEPWFVAIDVCRALDISQNRNAIARLDDDEKGVHTMDTLGGAQEMGIINEPGLYSLVLTSRKPEAKTFKRWITHDVIPSIRKHGAYMTPAKVDEILNDPDTIIRLATMLKEEREARVKLEEQAALNAPKLTYYEVVLQSPDLVSVSQICKDYGMSAVAFNKTLHDMGIQYKQGRTWMLYQVHADKGYTQTRTNVYSDRSGQQHSTVHTYWTQRGRLFLYEQLKAHGILPVIEAA